MSSATAAPHRTGGRSAPPKIAPLEQSPTKMIEIHAAPRSTAQAIPSTVAIAMSCADVRARLRRLAEQFGPLSLLEVTIREAAGTLAEFPELNGFYADGVHGATRRWESGSR